MRDTIMMNPTPNPIVLASCRRREKPQHRFEEMPGILVESKTTYLKVGSQSFNVELLIKPNST